MGLIYANNVTSTFIGHMIDIFQLNVKIDFVKKMYLNSEMIIQNYSEIFN